MLDFITKKIGNKLLVVFVALLFTVMLIEIIFRIYFGLPDRLKIAEAGHKEMMDTIFAMVKHPLTVGDSDTIHRDFEEIGTKHTNIDGYLCDFNKQISFSTDKKTIHKRVDHVIDNEDFSRAINIFLNENSELTFSKVFKVQGKRNLISIFPIKNSPECFHCHGSSKKILGAMVMKTNVEDVYKTVRYQMIRSIILTISAFIFAVFIINLVVKKLIKNPLNKLIDATHKFAKGEMVTIINYPKDEIGSLCETFNYMVNEVAKSKMELEKELTRRAKLLEERDELVALLQKANKQLKELDTLKSAFIANMSHELRTPMNAIIGYTDLLLDEVDGPLNEDQKASLRKVAANARHLLQLINDVLDISKIESGKIELKPAEVQLKALVDSIMVTFEPLIAKKGLSFTLNIEDGAEKLYVDEDKAKQILINLISNAVKFTHQGEITLR
ncbi:MAG: histidine kinase dimerization/phospho-acceptor domain-containing protein, partial [Thermodesulfovibrio sp.]